MASESQCKSLILLETPSRAIVPYDPGRTVDRVIASIGELIGRKMDKVAKKRGWGPTIAIERIQNILGEGNTREKVLLEMYTFWKENYVACHKFSDLQKRCVTLLEYTLPSESPGTQLTAFKGIVSLTTNYPYLRKFFHGFKKLRDTVDKEKAALDLWKRSGNLDDREWAFFGQMAAACLSDRDVTGIVERTPPDEMGLISDKDGGLIENLLRVINSCAHYNISCAVGTRYLGGILKSSPFWKEIGGVPHQYIVQTLLNATNHLMKDIGIECEASPEPNAEIFSDIEGVDILTHAILVGVKMWLKLNPTRRLEAQYWHAEFKAFFRLVILENAHRLLPRSRSQAMREYAWLVGYKEGQNIEPKILNKEHGHEGFDEAQIYEVESHGKQQIHGMESFDDERTHKPESSTFDPFSIANNASLSSRVAALPEQRRQLFEQACGDRWNPSSSYSNNTPQIASTTKEEQEVARKQLEDNKLIEDFYALIGSKELANQSEIPDSLVRPILKAIARPKASEKKGSRGGAAGYHCQWAGCSKELIKRLDHAKNHVREHCKSKPHTCGGGGGSGSKGCGGKFLRMDDLKRHQKSHCSVLKPSSGRRPRSVRGVHGSRDSDEDKDRDDEKDASIISDTANVDGFPIPTFHFSFSVSTTT